MARILFSQRSLPPLEEMNSFPPPDDTHLVEIYLRQVIDDLHKDPWAHRQFNKCPSRLLKIIRQTRDYGPVGLCVPRIVLMGNWLAAAGFEMEQYVKVFPLKKALVLCPDEDYIRSDISK